MTFCPHRLVSTSGSVNSSFVHFWSCLLGGLSTWDFVYFDSVHSGFCPRVVLSNWDSVYLGVCLFLIRLLGSLAT